jgi:hypothetical protein
MEFSFIDVEINIGTPETIPPADMISYQEYWKLSVGTFTDYMNQAEITPDQYTQYKNLKKGYMYTMVFSC